MLRVMHFDHQVYFSERYRTELAEYFQSVQDVNYHDYMITHSDSFESNQRDIELLLPSKDVFIVHTGIDDQKRIFDYHSLFPDLKIALVTAVDLDSYKREEERKDNIFIFSYTRMDQIKQFVLDQRSKK